MEEALTTASPEEEQERRRRTSPLFWLLWVVLIFCTLFWCGQLATRGSSGARPEGSASGLSADYRPWPGLIFGPVGPGFIEDLQKALGVIAPPSGSGGCLLGAVCAPIPSDTPTATRTPVPTSTPTVTRTPTRTPTRTLVPSWTPTRTRKPPTATPVPLCSGVTGGLSPSGDTIGMVLSNGNSGAIHLTSSEVSWTSGQTLTALQFRTISYLSGPDSTSPNSSSLPSPHPLPPGPGTGDWSATFDSVGPGTYDVTLNFGSSCSITRSLNVPTPVPPTATFTHTPTETPGTPVATPVNQPPTATIEDPSVNQVISAGGQVSFAGSGSDPDGDPFTYFWDFANGTTTSAEDPGWVTFITPGIYNVTLTVTDDGGLSGSDSVTITVN